MTAEALPGLPFWIYNSSDSPSTLQAPTIAFTKKESLSEAYGITGFETKKALDLSLSSALSLQGTMDRSLQLKVPSATK